MSGLAKEARPDLRGLWVLRQQASEQGEAIGEPKVLREMLKRLAAKEWAGGGGGIGEGSGMMTLSEPSGELAGIPADLLKSIDKKHVSAAVSKLDSASIGDICVVTSRSPAHKHYSLADIRE